SDKLQDAVHNCRGNRQLMHRIRSAFGVWRSAFGVRRLERCIDRRGLSLARVRIELDFSEAVISPARSQSRQTPDGKRRTPNVYTASKAAFTWSRPTPVLQLVGMTVMSGFKR